MNSSETPKGWEFGANGIKSTFSSGGGSAIQGTYSCETNALSNNDTVSPGKTTPGSWIKSPFLIWSSGNIKLDARLGVTGSNTYKVFFWFISWDKCANIHEQGKRTPIIYEYTMTNSTSVQNISFAVPAAVLNGRPWKLLVGFRGDGGSTRIRHDNWELPGKLAFYDTDNDKIPDALDKYPTDNTNNGKDAILARAWDDQDGDGIQDNCEPGFFGVAVSQRTGTGSWVSNGTTAYNGYVAFFDINAGSSRTLQFTTPANSAIALQDQGTDDNVDSDIGSNGYTSSFTTSSVVTNVAAGFLAPGTVNAFVWDDQDGDGIQDSGEPGISGSGVTLRKSNGDWIANATTNSGGIATFTNVPAGIALRLDFSVRTGGHAFTIANQGSDDAVDSDGDKATGITGNFTLTKGSQVYEDMDMGQWAPGTVNAFVWDDQDADGIQDSGEPGISGSAVTLRKSNGDWIANASTNSSGIATFTNVPAGMALRLHFAVRTGGHAFTIANQGSDDAVDSDGDKATGVTGNFTLTRGSQVYDSMDMGQWAPGTVNAFVWDDQDGDGMQDSGEPGISGSAVTLRKSNGDWIANATTNSSGIATFTNVPAGMAIKLQFSLRTGGHWFTGADAGSDDEIDSDGDTAQGITANFTLRRGSQVYDSMDMGQWAPGTITAFVFEDTDYDGIQDSGEPGISGRGVTLRNSNGDWIANATSNSSGLAVFNNVPAGRSLKLVFSKPSSNYIYSVQNVGSNDNIDSDPDYNTGTTANFRLSMGSQDFQSMDAGMIDINLDSDGDGIPNYMDKYATDATNNGKAAICSRVWDDLDGDGIQDNNEPGIGSVAVRLRTSGGTWMQNGTTHPAQGLVAFFDITTGSSVLLEVIKPASTIFTALKAGTNGNVDSDIQSSNNRTAAFTATGSVLNQDAGVLMPGTINSFVWDDRDGDGIQDSGEPGIQNIAVALRYANGNWIANATTNANGIATFEDVPTGADLYLDYTVPAGHTITTANAGSNENVDSDADPTSTNTGNFKLTRGSEVYNAADCGMWTPGTVNAFVWDDQDGDGIQDSGEPGISGNAVQLQRANGNWIATATTNSSGIATFTNVPTGIALRLDFAVLTAGHAFTTANAGMDDALDSDGDNVNGITGNFTLKRGSQVYDSMDMGQWAPGTVNAFVWDDQDADGIQDSGEPGISGNAVQLQRANGNWVASATTNSSGIATFTNVPAGIALRLDFAVRTAGHAFTIANQGSDDAVDSDGDKVNGITGNFTLTRGSQVYEDMDMGQWAPGTITTFVWGDADQDGLQDGGEAGRTGVSVTLRYANGNWIANATTNSSGEATFTNVPAGVDMYLTYTRPSGWTITPKDQGSDDAVDTDADPTSTRTVDFKLTKGSENYTLMDCGLYHSSLGSGGGSRVVLEEKKPETASHLQVQSDLKTGLKASEATRNNKSQTGKNTQPFAFNGVNVFPNPASTTVQIAINVQEAAAVSYVLTDMTGKAVVSGNMQLNAGSNTSILDVVNLPEGIYNLRLENGKSVHTTRIVVVKQ